MCCTLLSTGLGAAWCNDEQQDHHPWIQVDFTSAVYVAGLITQARGADSYSLQHQRVTRYRVAHSDDGYTWNNATRTDGAPAEVSDVLSRLHCNDKILVR